MSELILLCRPEEIGEARRHGLRIACAAWCIGGDGRLWRSPLPTLPKGSMMAVFGGLGENTEPLRADIAAECRRLNISEVLYFPSAPVHIGKLGYKLYIPASTAISGGSLAQRFACESTAFIEPCREYFALPCRSGNGVPISAKQLEIFSASAQCRAFSPELGCKYMLSPAGAVLYDDAETVGRKVELLRKTAVERIVLPYVSPSVREFLRKYL